MSLADEYERQLAWRAWPRILDALPPLAGRTVLDLGCAVGDLAAELSARGARVIGIDSNDELLGVAQSRKLPNVEFHKEDLRDLSRIGTTADGIWCSFAAAYFTDLSPVLAAWGERLRPGGFIALTEIDDMFGHEPLRARSKTLFEAYARGALEASRYDFHMGRKLEAHLGRAGFEVSSVFTVPDRELAFDGPAGADVIEAWRARLARMALLRDQCGAEFEEVRDDLLASLGAPDHRSTAKVYCCIATKSARG